VPLGAFTLISTAAHDDSFIKVVGRKSLIAGTDLCAETKRSQSEEKAFFAKRIFIANDAPNVVTSIQNVKELAELV
jgi:hypothetical protein